MPRLLGSRHLPWICIAAAACAPAAAAEPVTSGGGSAGEYGACELADPHAWARERVIRPRAWSEVSATSSEAGLVFETASGARAAFDVFIDRERALVHAELWVEGELAQVATVSGEAYLFDPMFPPLAEEDAGTSAAALWLLGGRFAAASCRECCEAARRLAAPLAGASLGQPSDLELCDVSSEHGD